MIRLGLMIMILAAMAGGPAGAWLVQKAATSPATVSACETTLVDDGTGSIALIDDGSGTIGIISKAPAC